MLGVGRAAMIGAIGGGRGLMGAGGENSGVGDEGNLFIVLSSCSRIFRESVHKGCSGVGERGDGERMTPLPDATGVFCVTL